VITTVYTLPGVYTATLTATNCATATATAVHTLTVVQPCDPVHDADFAWTPLTPTVGQEASFSAAVTGTSPISCTWDWGDGSLSLAPCPLMTHTYTLPGLYTAVLTATNCGTATATAVHTLTVLPEPCEPVSIVTVTQAISGCAVTLGVTLTGDPPFTYLWQSGTLSSTLPAPAFDFGASGTYTVTLAVGNCGGAGSDALAFPVQVSCPGRRWTIYLPLVFKGGTP
jgi:PKD repeat protein